MKKRILFAFLVLFAGVVAFCGTRSEDVVDPAAPTTCSDGSCPLRNPNKSITIPVTHMEIVDVENIEITFSNPGWAKEEHPTDSFTLAEENKEEQCKLLVVKEPTINDFGKYVLDTLRDFIHGGLRLYEYQQLVINNQNFVRSQDIHPNKSAWIWITQKDNFGYWFMCMCRTDADSGAVKQDLCQSIADSIEIK